MVADMLWRLSVTLCGHRLCAAASVTKMICSETDEPLAPQGQASANLKSAPFKSTDELRNKFKNRRFAARDQPLNLYEITVRQMCSCKLPFSVCAMPPLVKVSLMLPR